MTDPTPRPSAPSDPRAARHPLGLSFPALIALALLAVPRVILHDLGVLTGATAINALLVFVPPIVWIAVALWARAPRPFLTILVIGAIYGVFLAAGHQLLWHVAFGDEPPRLGGNLAGLAPAAQELIMRLFAAVSSFFTGVLVGAIAGLIAWGLHALIRPRA